MKVANNSKWLDFFPIKNENWNSASYIYILSAISIKAQAKIQYDLNKRNWYLCKPCFGDPCAHAIKTGSVKQSFPSPTPANISLPVNPPAY